MPWVGSAADDGGPGTAIGQIPLSRNCTGIRHKRGQRGRGPVYCGGKSVDPPLGQCMAQIFSHLRLRRDTNSPCGPVPGSAYTDMVRSERRRA